jgi:adenine phosphoribosyltransferase
VVGYRNEWERRGRYEGHRVIVLRQLRRKFGVVPPAILRRVETLPGEQFMPLGLALLDLSNISELVAWLDAPPTALEEEGDEDEELEEESKLSPTLRSNTLPRYLKLIDTTTSGRYDVTPLFADHAAFTALVADLAAPFAGSQVAYVAGIDALGFILGTAVALQLGVGFVPIRKGDKLPGAKRRAIFVDYTGQQKALELRADAVSSGARVLLVDEWIETGAQVRAAIELLEAQGAQLVGVATIAMDDNARTRELRSRYRCHALTLDL